MDAESAILSSLMQLFCRSVHTHFSTRQLSFVVSLPCRSPAFNTKMASWLPAWRAAPSLLMAAPPNWTPRCPQRKSQGPMKWLASWMRRTANIPRQTTALRMKSSDPGPLATGFRPARPSPSLPKTAKWGGWGKHPSAHEKILVMQLPMSGSGCSQGERKAIPLQISMAFLSKAHTPPLSRQEWAWWDKDRPTRKGNCTVANEEN